MTTDFCSLLDYFLKIEDLTAERRALLRDYSLAHFQAFGTVPDLDGYKRAPSVKVRVEVEALRDIAGCTKHPSSAADNRPTVQGLKYSSFCAGDFDSRFKPLWYGDGTAPGGWYWHDGASMAGPFSSYTEAHAHIESTGRLLTALMTAR